MEKKINFFKFWKRSQPETTTSEVLDFNSDTFCVSPFLSCYVGTENNLSPCCINQLTDINAEKNLLKTYNHPKLRELRKSLINGIKHDSCTTCWKNESIGLPSLREEQNRLFKKYLGEIKKNLNEDFTVSKLNIKYLDVRFSNKCNLKCRHVHLLTVLVGQQIIKY